MQKLLPHVGTNGGSFGDWPIMGERPRLRLVADGSSLLKTLLSVADFPELRTSLLLEKTVLGGVKH